jgi:hypothetical protein
MHMERGRLSMCKISAKLVIVRFGTLHVLPHHRLTCEMLQYSFIWSEARQIHLPVWIGLWAYGDSMWCLPRTFLLVLFLAPKIGYNFQENEPGEFKTSLHLPILTDADEELLSSEFPKGVCLWVWWRKTGELCFRRQLHDWDNRSGHCRRQLHDWDNRSGCTIENTTYFIRA